MSEPRYVSGTELCAEDQRRVLSEYVHRFTKDHVPSWARTPRADGRTYRPQFASDAEWLQLSRFAVRSDGRLDNRVKTCASSPTWPDGV